MLLGRRVAAAECVGTFVLVFGGVGTAVVAGRYVGALGIALAFGLSLLAMAYAIGPISGCHINPAVTVGLLTAGRIRFSEAIQYWAGQFLGAVLASLALYIVIKSRSGGYDLSDNGFGANGYGKHSPDGYSLGGVLLVEVLLTGLLVFTVLSATDRIAEVAFAGIPIGLVLTLIHLVGIPVDNLSVNPARSFGPASFVGGWALGQLWAFIVAPVAGAVLGAKLHEFLFSGSRPIDLEASAVAADAPAP
jgi:aquaporin Z